ncbi:MAG: hypothetical protein EXR77_13630 [Myxococcales bacterium]|nr:hypothetical protein [Myxococcales bacterium]
MTLSVHFASWQFDLRSASDLRGAMRTCLRDAEYLGGPNVLVGRDVDIAAWSWLGEVCLLRSDWLPAVAAALRDVIANGTPMEHQALVDLLANETATVRLLPWTAGWALGHGDWTGTRSGTGWGGSSTAPRLDHVLANQERYAEAWSAKVHEVPWKTQMVALNNPEQLRALLEQTARAGRGPVTPQGDHGWDWLVQQVAFVPWVGQALAELLPWALTTDAGLGYAALDYLLIGQDAWLWLDCVRRWRQNPPWWARTPLKNRPKGWTRRARHSHDSALTTYGDLALRFETLHGRQGPPLLDLAPP